jgi:hypothetical protein
MRRRSSHIESAVLVVALMTPLSALAQADWCQQAALDDVSKNRDAKAGVEVAKGIGLNLHAGGTDKEDVVAVIARLERADTLIPRLMIFSVVCKNIEADGSKTPEQKNTMLREEWKKTFEAPTVPTLLHQVHGTFPYAYDKRPHDVPLWETDIPADAIVTFSVFASAGMDSGRALAVKPTVDPASEVSCPEIRQINAGGKSQLVTVPSLCLVALKRGHYKFGAAVNADDPDPGPMPDGRAFPPNVGGSIFIQLGQFSSVP